MDLVLATTLSTRMMYRLEQQPATPAIVRYVTFSALLLRMNLFVNPLVKVYIGLR